MSPPGPYLRIQDVEGRIACFPTIPATEASYERDSLDHPSEPPDELIGIAPPGRLLPADAERLLQSRRARRQGASPIGMVRGTCGVADGNKRVAAAVAEIFIEINNSQLTLTNDQIVDLFLRIAAGELSREEVDQIFLESVETS